MTISAIHRRILQGLTKDKRDAAIVAAYIHGASLREVAGAIQLSPTAISNILVSRGIPLRPVGVKRKKKS
jgi:DNA-binding Lrp family transcriptional regulator